jgi:hypothetical protein
LFGTASFTSFVTALQDVLPRHASAEGPLASLGMTRWEAVVPRRKPRGLVFSCENEILRSAQNDKKERDDKKEREEFQNKI